MGLYYYRFEWWANYWKCLWKRIAKNKSKGIPNKKIKGDKLYVKWKGYDNSFSSWTDKKSIV